MTADELAHVELICTHPEQDNPRLEYADWLEENGLTCPQCKGDPNYWTGLGCARCDGRGTVSGADRAEFIRVGCELATKFGGVCQACGRPLTDDRVADGCPCNSPRGVNHGVVPAYVCTCPECDPDQTGSARARPADVEALRRRERELWVRSLRDWYQEQMPERPCCVTIDEPDRNVAVPVARIRRGFVAELTCTAADWLAVADRLVWRPAACDWCGGSGRFTHSFDPPCHRCRGTGRVPRPCPATAQPIERVTLTSIPVEGFMSGFDHDPETGDVIHSRWPGVAFTLPGADRGLHNDAVRARLEQIQQMVAAGSMSYEQARREIDATPPLR